jgi:hypothetical protein
MLESARKAPIDGIAATNSQRLTSVHDWERREFEEGLIVSPISSAFFAMAPLAGGAEPTFTLEFHDGKVSPLRRDAGPCAVQA